MKMMKVILLVYEAEAQHIGREYQQIGFHYCPGTCALNIYI